MASAFGYDNFAEYTHISHRILDEQRNCPISLEDVNDEPQYIRILINKVIITYKVDDIYEWTYVQNKKYDPTTRILYSDYQLNRIIKRKEALKYIPIDTTPTELVKEYVNGNMYTKHYFKFEDWFALKMKNKICVYDDEKSDWRKQAHEYLIDAPNIVFLIRSSSITFENGEKYNGRIFVVSYVKDQQLYHKLVAHIGGHGYGILLGNIKRHIKLSLDDVLKKFHNWSITFLDLLENMFDKQILCDYLIYLTNI